MGVDETALSLGERADEADWRALVEQGLKGADWRRLTSTTADGLAIQPLYREPDMHTAEDVSGFPGAAPFVRGRAGGPWLIRQAFEHPDPERSNHDILADLQGGVGGAELVIDPAGEHGIALRDAADLDLVLANVILEAAPISLDAGAHGLWAGELLRAKLKGVAAAGTALNVDPVGALMRTGAIANTDLAHAAAFAERARKQLPLATSLRVDARALHEAGGSEAQEIATALASGIAYLRALSQTGLSIADAGACLNFALAIGPEILVETAKLRALRLCWARVMEAAGAAPESRFAPIHAFTSRRMMTRYDAHTNILRVTTAAFAAAIGGADAITTRPFTDALGLPTPFARRVARNTQNVLLEESRLGHVADPAGGAWFVEKLTREMAEKAWTIMQEIEAKGGIVATLQTGYLQDMVATARAVRERAIATRRETITGVTDYPLLGVSAPEIVPPTFRTTKPAPPESSGDIRSEPLGAVRWAAPFEVLRARAEHHTPRPAVFFANLGPLASAGPRAQFARNLFAAGGVGAVGEEAAYASRDVMIEAFRASGARVAVICGADSAYADDAENAARLLKAAVADWVILAGKPGEREAALRAAGVDQFVFAGQDALNELDTLHAALGILS
jgi:methylmalonyl-CoA mutase